MIEIYRKSLTNYRQSIGDEPREDFEVKGRSESPITLADATKAVGELAADLAQVVPPLPEGFADSIIISTSREHSTSATFVVAATFERTDETTQNGEALGYLMQGYWLPADAIA